MIQKKLTNELLPDNARGTIYSLGAAVVTLIGVFGWTTEEQAAAVGVAVVSVATAVLAVIHSRTLWRQALYLVLAAAGSILVAWGLGTHEQVGAVLGLTLVVLGMAAQAQNTPKLDDSPAGRHAAVE